MWSDTTEATSEITPAPPSADRRSRTTGAGSRSRRRAASADAPASTCHSNPRPRNRVDSGCSGCVTSCSVGGNTWRGCWLTGVRDGPGVIVRGGTSTGTLPTATTTSSPSRRPAAAPACLRREDDARRTAVEVVLVVRIEPEVRDALCEDRCDGRVGGRVRSSLHTGGAAPRRRSAAARDRPPERSRPRADDRFDRT